MQEQIEQRVESGGIHRATTPCVILAFAKELSAQREAVEVLLIRQFARTDTFQRTQGRSSLLLQLGFECLTHNTQLTFPGLEAGVCGENRLTLQECFEVSIENSLELARRCVHA